MPLFEVSIRFLRPSQIIKVESLAMLSIVFYYCFRPFLVYMYIDDII